VGGAAAVESAGAPGRGAPGGIPNGTLGCAGRAAMIWLTARCTPASLTSASYCWRRVNAIENLAGVGLHMPPPAAAVSSYDTWVCTGDLIVTSGQLPWVDGVLQYPGRLGAEVLIHQERDWTTLPTADPTAPHYFLETGHAIAPEFWEYWSSHGLDLGDPGLTFRESLGLFGYPLSEPMIEPNNEGAEVLSQYFERAVFEYHPDNPEPYRVLLRRLGAEFLTARGW